MQSEPRAVGRTVGVIAGAAALPAGAWLAHPALAAILLILVAAIVFSALWGSETVSERAFRLGRMIAGRSEPKAPPPGQIGQRQAQKLSAQPYEVPGDPQEMLTLGAIARRLGLDGKTVTQYRPQIEERAAWEQRGQRRLYRLADVVEVLNARRGAGSRATTAGIGTTSGSPP